MCKYDSEQNSDEKSQKQTTSICEQTEDTLYTTSIISIENDTLK